MDATTLESLLALRDDLARKIPVSDILDETEPTAEPERLKREVDLEKVAKLVIDRREEVESKVLKRDIKKDTLMADVVRAATVSVLRAKVPRGR